MQCGGQTTNGRRLVEGSARHQHFLARPFEPAPKDRHCVREPYGVGGDPQFGQILK